MNDTGPPRHRAAKGPRLGMIALLALATGCGSTAEAGGEPAPNGAGDAGDAATSAERDPAAVAPIRIEARGMIFDARAAGPEDGELILLLHGFPQTSYEWRDVLPALGRAGFRAVAPDQRGYSPDARPAAVEDYDVAELVGDVMAMADVLGAERFHIAGHDWGAAVTWGVATLFADRVITATPMSVPHPDAFAALLADPSSAQYAASAYFEMFSQPGFESTMLANDAAFFRGIFAGLDDEVVDEYLAVLGTEAAVGAALNWYRANVSGRSLRGELIGPTPVRTLFIWSDGDTAIVREGVDLTADYVTGPYRLEVLEGVDHWLVDREPERVTELLLEHAGG